MRVYIFFSIPATVSTDEFGISVHVENEDSCNSLSSIQVDRLQTKEHQNYESQPKCYHSVLGLSMDSQNNGFVNFDVSNSKPVSDR